MMKQNWLLFAVSTIATLAISLLVIRWLAPGLLGIPVDLQMVQVEKKLPPFFESVFREEDRKSNLLILQDPVSNIRAHPLIFEQGFIGPHDILGFRNRQVPNVADVIIIGDSQTYGVNVPIDFNWPSTINKILSNKQLSVYNMSVGGWSGIQYSYIAQYALQLRPRAIIVAFYSGNDPLESFTLAYGSDIWKEFRMDPDLDKSDAPQVDFPPPKEEEWSVTFSDGVQTVFVPKLRLASNFEHPAVKTGYNILALVAEKITDLARPLNIAVAFTIIPTKELVYAEKIKKEQITAPDDYRKLIANEKKNIDWLQGKITSLPNAMYIDVLTPLQQQALYPSRMYPEGQDGHPLLDGYHVIGKTIARQIDPLFRDFSTGLALRSNKDGLKPDILFIGQRKYWIFSSPETARDNGWDLSKEYALVIDREIEGFEYMGIINTIDKENFGPQ